MENNCKKLLLTQHQERPPQAAMNSGKMQKKTYKEQSLLLHELFYSVDWENPVIIY